MSNTRKTWLAFGLIAALLAIIGFAQSWNVSLGILNLCIISAVMALGVNMQWGYAGLLNVGVMGFAALGGVSAVLVSEAPIAAAWDASWGRLSLAAISFIATILLSVICYRRLLPGRIRGLGLTLTIVAGLALTRWFLDPAVASIEAIEPAKTGFLGGMGLPIIFSWLFGGVVAAGIAWCIGKVALGLRADYLAIATLGISEIIIAVLKNEDWLSRGVKNVTGLSRPVPYEIDLQTTDWFIEAVRWWHSGSLAAGDDVTRQTMLKQFVIDSSSIFVKLCYTGLFAAVLALVLLLSVKALSSPWGRMMRAIRDNEIAAGAMGKDVTPPRNLHHRLRRDRHRRRHADHAGRAVYAHILPAAALHLPHLGNGHRRRFRQQHGLGAGGVFNLDHLDRGRARWCMADGGWHRLAR